MVEVTKFPFVGRITSIELTDVQDFTTITKRINGGLSGLAERKRYYETAKKAFGLAP